MNLQQMNYACDHMLKLIKGESAALAKAIFMYALTRWAKADGTFCLSAGQAAEALGSNQRSCQRAIKTLQDCGAVTLVGDNRGGYSNQYRINLGLLRADDCEACDE